MVIVLGRGKAGYILLLLTIWTLAPAKFQFGSYKYSQRYYSDIRLLVEHQLDAERDEIKMH